MNKFKLFAAFFIVAVPLVLYSCEGKRLTMHEAPLYGPTAPNARQSDLIAGQDEPRPALAFEANEEILIEGKRLYGWYNCAGCHFNGGGGIGPPFMDDEWIYGSEPQNIADSIINGRPQGMPAYGGRIPAAHVAPIVAYVRALSGLEKAGAPTPTPIPKFKDKDKPIEELQKEIPGVKQQQQQHP
jgi:cytochrome c oxidase cbb3-type subunit III